MTLQLAKLGKGLPLTNAFALRDKEEHLSVNWLEYFEKPDLDQAIDCVRQAFLNKGYTIRANGRFAVLRVGEVKMVISDVSPYPAKVERQPKEDDRSHCGVFGYTGGISRDRLIAAKLARLVHAKDVHPAISP